MTINNMSVIYVLDTLEEFMQNLSPEELTDYNNEEKGRVYNSEKRLPTMYGDSVFILCDYIKYVDMILPPSEQVSPYKQLTVGMQILKRYYELEEEGLRDKGTDFIKNRCDKLFKQEIVEDFLRANNGTN